MSQRCYYIPRVINQQYLYVWRTDEIPLLIAPILWFFLLGLGWSSIFLFLISEILAAQTLKYLGADKPNGYIIHWVRFNFPKAFMGYSVSAITAPKSHSTLTIKKSIYKRSSALPMAHLRYLAG
jgi:hypothetical protein